VHIYFAGKEHGVGIYISSVIRGSRADIAGLKVKYYTF
jgi:hypothetical protein